VAPGPLRIPRLFPKKRWSQSRDFEGEEFEREWVAGRKQLSRH
jgi:hypothetical protein